ncbi:MAG: HAD-IIIC family phosphatase [Treponema sp.]|jgi:FkbH-like protein|nr:HAD-IIIC family phosphatase [Treponema sp.]
MLTFLELQRNLKKESASMPAVKAALLGDTATQFLAAALRGTAVERGFRLDLFEAEFNQIERQIMDPQSEFHAFGADYAVIFQSTHKLLCHYDKLAPEKQAALADERIDFIRLLCASFPGRIIYCNYPEIDDTVFGGFACKIEHSFVWQTRKLNYELMKLARGSAGLFICDLAALQNKLGRDAMFDASIYTASEMILSLDSVPQAASRIMDVICAAQGQIKKCLILDLDNTLWGGVIGDDGIENIQLGHDLGIGKVFTEFQGWIRKLKNRGIILAVCSKNNENTAKEPFEKHPEMVLKLEDISVFMANWDNKADNIRRIQSILNIGFDSMVFLDDNPVERAMVRENIPGITVPELPADPADYLEYLYGLNLFETVSVSAEDAERTGQYRAEARRVEAQTAFADEGEFLASLEMVSEAKDFDAFNIPRAAQLSQRSNQFNLRTVRYTEADAARLAACGRYKNWCFTLRDKFGDNGLICVIILEKQDAQTLFIDTWLMSCRVLKRGMEQFTLNTIAAWAREAGFKRLIGEYIPTAKNKMVESHYPGLGFEPLPCEGRILYTLDVGAYKPKKCFIAGARQNE